MQLTDYFSLDTDRLHFSREQSSAFAKSIAGDFNPIHNIDAKRFCVPGDLLFAVFLHRYGVRQSMEFEFSGMVGDGTELLLPVSIGDEFSLDDIQGKNYLNVKLSGNSTTDETFVGDMIKNYVQFSGQTFPHILVNLMQVNNVMINPDRPLVIYKNMSIKLEKLTGNDVSLQLEQATLKVGGKKGEAQFNFSINAGGICIGSGEKRMVLSGLREYDQSRIDDVVNAYAEWKSAYQVAG